MAARRKRVPPRKRLARETKRGSEDFSSDEGAKKPKIAADLDIDCKEDAEGVYKILQPPRDVSGNGHWGCS